MKTPSEWWDAMARGVAPQHFLANCPLLPPLVGVAQDPRHHAHDVWDHTAAAYHAAAGYEPLVRLAVLLHDVGKPATRGIHPKTGLPTFYEHHEVGAEMVDAWMREVGFGEYDRNHVVFLVRHHMDLMRMPDVPTDKAVRRWAHAVGSYRDPLFAVYRADVIGKGRDAADDLARGERLRERAIAAPAGELNHAPASTLAISGADVMRERGIGPGPEVGRVLRELDARVTGGTIPNERDALLDLCRSI